MRRRENLKLQQFHCPSCGQNITQLTPFKASIECPYCHQVSLNPLVVDKSILVPERVIPFTVSRDDFGEMIIEELVDEPNLPLDLFDQITFGTVIKAFLPMFEYTGSFDGVWNCEEAYTVEHKRRRNNTTVVERETRYRPVSGQACGNYSVLALAYQGKDIPREFQRFVHVFNTPEANSYPFNPELMGLDSGEQILALEMNLEPRNVWVQQAEDYVKARAVRACENQAPRQRRNFRCSTSIDPDEEGVYTMVPFWLVNFFYDGETWNFLADGTGSWRHLSAPKSTLIFILRWLGVLIGLGCAVAPFVVTPPNSEYRIPAIGAALVGTILWYVGYNAYNRHRRIKGACRAFPQSKFAHKHR